MSDQHALPPDEDDSVHEAVEGIPGKVPEPDPDAFRPDVEADDPENENADA